jgi:hypothetical protein
LLKTNIMSEETKDSKESIPERVERDAKQTEELFAKQLGREISTTQKTEDKEGWKEHYGILADLKEEEENYAEWKEHYGVLADLEEEKERAKIGEKGDEKKVEITPEEIKDKDRIEPEEEEPSLLDDEISDEKAKEIADERGWGWADEDEEGDDEIIDIEDTEDEEEEIIETEAERRRAERKRKMYKIISKVAGIGGAVLGAKGGYIAAGAITAAYGPIGLAGVVVAGGYLFIERKRIGSFLSRIMDRTIQELENEMRTNEDPELRRRLENNKAAKEILASFFTGVTGGAGAGLVFGGLANINSVVNDVYPAEPTSPDQIVGEGDLNFPAETLPAETEVLTNFGELEGSAHLVEQLNLNPDVVNQAMQEGRLLGENLLLEGGTIADPQGMFVDIINHADLTNIDLGTTENTRTFLEGIYEINKQVLSGNQIGEEFIKDIASRTIEGFQQAAK